MLKSSKVKGGSGRMQNVVNGGHGCLGEKQRGGLTRGERCKHER